MSEEKKVVLGFYFDQSKCTGCKTCHVSCKSRSDLKDGLIWRRVYESAGGTFQGNADGSFNNDVHAFYTSVSCNHCGLPACTAACPVGAVHKDEKTGLVLPDDEKCIGCGMCASACPYDAPQIDTERRKMTKCDGCIDRLEIGLKPICVESCPLHALDFGDMEELRAKYGDSDPHLAPLPDQKATMASLIIKRNKHGSKPTKVINAREV
ncbi:DMSO/selenate family reductase complex B subunit [Shewanella sp. 10N.286.45.A1]|uniref:DMSO/selenate family reductase complex B subunit n=1 Tax=Shewanella sp. 10N.286.45.A1 TaxID=3229694 RepID=UPI003552F78B